MTKPTPFFASFSVVIVASCGGAQPAAEVQPTVLIEGNSMIIVDEGDAQSVPLEIRFHLDSDVIEERSHPALDVLAEALTSNPDIAMVEVQGHSDERGTYEYNLGLSSRRADAVIAHLVGKGVDRARLRGRGFGANRPAARGAGEAAWRQNRRVEFLIVDRR
jgi:outer membrane protein OmpA-like peptidoglycan-associated protein